VSGSQAIERWLEAYEASWSTGSGVKELFTLDARYFSAPYRPPLVGPAAIETWWIEQGETDTRWVFERRVIATEGDLHVSRARPPIRTRPAWPVSLRSITTFGS
jgi:hypothetical protein